MKKRISQYAAEVEQIHARYLKRRAIGEAIINNPNSGWWDVVRLWWHGFCIKRYTARMIAIAAIINTLEA